LRASFIVHSVVLRIVDNGQGFDGRRAEGGGLRGIRDRAPIVGAKHVVLGLALRATPRARTFDILGIRHGHDSPRAGRCRPDHGPDGQRDRPAALPDAGETGVAAVIGGFHLSGPMFEPIIEATVAAFDELKPELLMPAHCTGWKAVHRLAGRFPDAFVQSTVGTTIAL